jgi:hypothetical protein
MTAKATGLDRRPRSGSGDSIAVAILSRLTSGHRRSHGVSQRSTA